MMNREKSKPSKVPQNKFKIDGRIMRTRLSLILLFICILLHAEDGSRLWMPSQPNSSPANVTLRNAKGECALIAKRELSTFWKEGSVLLEINKDKVSIQLGEEGFQIHSDGKSVRIISSGEKGLMYGAYELLRMQQSGVSMVNMNIQEKPSYKIRILDHWDNPDGTIERGFAGHSLWRWDELPGKLSPRYAEYARANASIGINGCVLNNVNASPKVLEKENLIKVKALADVFRPYGIRVYLSVNFASPLALGDLKTADPLDKNVAKWWKSKAKEIYSLIPDFGGFLVKANSEGQPGPGDYKRTHAEGANMLAEAIKPYGGIIMWRAFVYKANDKDRAKQAFQEFQPLDGQFRDNVIIQIKNGPVDFQPREPFSPLFGALSRTQEMIEFQITQEYLGAANHLVFLAPLFKECLESDTYRPSQGSTIAKITEKALYGYSAIAGVANIGDDVNWCGHHFAQANWYAFGRLAWNSNLSSEQISKEWLKQTFSSDERFVEPVSKMMLESREAAVHYMMPLGIHHIFAGNHHYGPEPWYFVKGLRADWQPFYYHKADSLGMGFDRSSQGTDAVHQYAEPLCSQLDNVNTCPEKYLLWFHHVAWSHKLSSGKSLWEELCNNYQLGLNETRNFQKCWDSVEDYVDLQRFQDVQRKLKIQTHDAQWWKDACLLYFQQFSKMPFPADYERPVYNLDDLKKVRIPLGLFGNPTRDMLP